MVNNTIKTLYLLNITDKNFNEMPYDKTHMMIVSAENEEEARSVAATEDDPFFWLDSLMACCTVLIPTKESSVMYDFGWGSG